LKFFCSIILIIGCVACSRPRAEEKAGEATGIPLVGSVTRLDTAVTGIVPSNAKIEQITSGYNSAAALFYHRDGFLLFSDTVRNTIYKWTPDGAVVEYRKPSGYDGSAQPKGTQNGSNCITMDSQYRLVVCEQGNHRITRSDVTDRRTVLAETFEGKRLNGPADAVYKSDGSLYFTDPSFAFPKGDADPAKELKFNGVYRLSPEGKLTLLTKELAQPYGIALSPDEKLLYVANSDATRKVWMRYELRPDGTLGEGNVFFDAGKIAETGLPAGVKVDTGGNVYCAGPGGVLVVSPQGKHLGTIKLPEPAVNMHWGKYADTTTAPAMASKEYATTLYITTGAAVYRIALSAVGIRP
jgi:gluconolactonase